MADEYSLAPGFDNTAGYAVIHATTVSGVRFVHVQGVGSYDDGEENTYIDGSKDDTGEALFTWLFTRLTFDQYDYLLDTVGGGLRSSRVTARTRFRNLDWQDVNAIMTLPKVSTLTRTFNYYTDVRVSFLVKGIL